MADPVVISAVVDRGGRKPTRAERFVDRLIENRAVILNDADEIALAEIARTSEKLLADLADRATVVGVGAAGTRAKLDAAIQQAQELSAAANREHRAAVLKGAEHAAREQGEALTEAMTGADLSDVAADFVGLSSTQIRQAVARPYFGWTTEQWMDWHALEEGLSIDRELRAGYFAGESIDKIVSRMAAVSTKTDAALRTTARTAINSASNAAAQDLYRRNRDILSGEQWLATLDNRTCELCGPLDGQVYQFDKPHPVPPRHPQCRCMLVPTIKGHSSGVPTWSGWIAGEFGGLSEAKVYERQRKVLGHGVTRLIRDPSSRIEVSDLITPAGKKRTLADLESLSRSRKRSRRAA